MCWHFAIFATCSYFTTKWAKTSIIPQMTFNNTFRWSPNDDTDVLKCQPHIALHCSPTCCQKFNKHQIKTTLPPTDLCIPFILIQSTLSLIWHSLSGAKFYQIKRMSNYRINGEIYFCFIKNVLDIRECQIIECQIRESWL